MKFELVHALKRRVAISGEYSRYTFATGCYGSEAIAKAVHDCLTSGKTVHLVAFKKHPVEAGDNEKLHFTFGSSTEGRETVLRWCGTDGHPDGNGSHSIILSGWEHTLDPAYLSAAVAMHICESCANSGMFRPHIFRDLWDFPEFIEAEEERMD